MRTCRNCRKRKPDYEFPQKKWGKMGIQKICRKCKEERKKQKQEQRTELRRKRAIKFRQRKRQRIQNPVFTGFTVNSVLYQKIDEHVTKFGHPSKAAFYRDAINHQLNREQIFCIEQKHSKIVQCGANISKQTLNEIKCSTASTNYSSFSEFVRTAIKKQIQRDNKNVQNLRGESQK